MIRVRQEADKDRGNLERKKEPEWKKRKARTNNGREKKKRERG